MIIIRPISITEPLLTDTNVPETDYPTWLVGTTYALGDFRIYDHKIYESLQNSNLGNQPDISPTFWLDSGATNRYKMFDGIVNRATTNTGTVDVTITPNATIVTGVVLFNIMGATVQVQVIDPVDGVVYDETIELADFTAITGPWYYFFAPVDDRQTNGIAFLDLPAVPNGDIRVVVDNGLETAQVGELILGNQTVIGVANFGTSVGIDDYSIKETNEFGDVTIVERPYNDRVDYDLTIETSRVGFVKRFLIGIRATPCVYIGDADREETITLGFFKTLDILLANPSISDCTLQVRGVT